MLYSIALVACQDNVPASDEAYYRSQISTLKKVLEIEIHESYNVHHKMEFKNYEKIPLIQEDIQATITDLINTLYTENNPAISQDILLEGIDTIKKLHEQYYSLGMFADHEEYAVEFRERAEQVHQRIISTIHSFFRDEKEAKIKLEYQLITYTYDLWHTTDWRPRIVQSFELDFIICENSRMDMEVGDTLFARFFYTRTHKNDDLDSTLILADNDTLYYGKYRQIYEDLSSMFDTQNIGTHEVELCAQHKHIRLGWIYNGCNTVTYQVLPQQ